MCIRDRYQRRVHGETEYKKEMASYSYLFKFIIVGDTNVGKSCLMMQFIEKKFRLEQDNTIGVEFGSRFIKVKDKVLKLQIWDTVNSTTHHSLIPTRLDRSNFVQSLGLTTESYLVL
eukprot:TRINITY_DN8687_c0_g1_i10.p1 TRINITY_DN8687_c0_g1~~TRINITY_DN8687_c0_g1_i10.p1  ORF type:complete len:117 (-),score=19.55 TRINITY_DN8687_c0_g1_i10:543-893(-)